MRCCETAQYGSSEIASARWSRCSRSPVVRQIGRLRIGRISGRRLAPESVEASCNRGADGRARAMIRAEPLPAAVVRPVNLCI